MWFLGFLDILILLELNFLMRKLWRIFFFLLLSGILGRLKIRWGSLLGWEFWGFRSYKFEVFILFLVFVVFLFLSLFFYFLLISICICFKFEDNDCYFIVSFRNFCVFYCRLFWLVFWRFIIVLSLIFFLFFLGYITFLIFEISFAWFRWVKYFFKLLLFRCDCIYRMYINFKFFIL